MASTHPGFYKNVPHAILCEGSSACGSQKCQALIPEFAIDDALPAHLFSEIKDDLGFPDPSSRSHATPYPDAAVEQALGEDGAWKSIVSSANFAGDSVEEGLWVPSGLPSHIRLEACGATLLSFFRDKWHDHAAQQLLMPQGRDEAAIKAGPTRACPLIRPESVQALREEALHKAEEGQIRCIGTTDLDQQCGEAQELAFLEMASTVKDERRRTGQPPSADKAKEPGKRRRAETKEEQVKHLVPCLKPGSCDEHLKNAQAGFHDDKWVKRHKSGDGDMRDSVAGKERSWKSDNSMASTCDKQVTETNEEKSGGEPPQQDYVHVRARRGQATDSHSLAERVRREKISERMKVLQNLVPNCNKVVGKALMLDEIINYVQSLQRQVELLSTKLAIVSSALDFSMRDHSHSQVDSNYAIAPGSSVADAIEIPHICFLESSTGGDYGSSISDIRSQAHIGAGVIPYLGY